MSLQKSANRQVSLFDEGVDRFFIVWIKKRSSLHANTADDTALCRYALELSTVSTPLITSPGRFMINWAYWATMCVCVCLCLCLWGPTQNTHIRVCVCVQRFVCVRVPDLLTHVFNWNCMQSAYCSTNRIRTWWCQPKFFRGILSVLCSHTVRQDHLAHLTETPIETGSTTTNAPVYLTYIFCHYNHKDDYFPFIFSQVNSAYNAHIFIAQHETFIFFYGSVCTQAIRGILMDFSMLFF